MEAAAQVELLTSTAFTCRYLADRYLILDSLKSLGSLGIFSYGYRYHFSKHNTHRYTTRVVGVRFWTCHNL